MPKRVWPVCWCTGCGIGSVQRGSCAHVFPVVPPIGNIVSYVLKRGEALTNRCHLDGRQARRQNRSRSMRGQSQAQQGAGGSGAHHHHHHADDTRNTRTTVSPVWCVACKHMAEGWRAPDRGQCACALVQTFRALGVRFFFFKFLNPRGGIVAHGFRSFFPPSALLCF